MCQYIFECFEKRIIIFARQTSHENMYICDRKQIKQMALQKCL